MTVPFKLLMSFMSPNASGWRHDADCPNRAWPYVTPSAFQPRLPHASVQARPFPGRRHGFPGRRPRPRRRTDQPSRHRGHRHGHRDLGRSVPLARGCRRQAGDGLGRDREHPLAETAGGRSPLCRPARPGPGPGPGQGPHPLPGLPGRPSLQFLAGRRSRARGVARHQRRRLRPARARVAHGAGPGRPGQGRERQLGLQGRHLRAPA